MNASPEIQQMVSELIDQLTTDEINKDNLRKAGTQIEQNMSMDFQKRIEERFIELRKEFNEIDTNQDAFLSIQELYNFFSSKNPSVKKEDIQSLFELSDHDKNSKISLNEFVKIYILLEEKLKLKMEELMRIKNSNLGKLQRYQNKLKDYEKEEFYPQGFSKQNELVINIIQITDLQGMGKYKITLNLIDKSGKILDEKETQEKKGSNPRFDEKFSFHVLNDKCYVRCTIIDSESLINENRGYFDIKLGDYLDQLKKEEWINILGEESEAKVQISCCFIYDHKKKYSDIIAKYSQQIDQLTQSIIQLENLIGKIGEPYGLLNYNKIKEIKDKRILDSSENVNELLANSHISIYSSQRNSKFSYSESPNKLRYSGPDDNINKARNRIEGLDVIQEEGGEAMNSKLLKNEIKSTEGYLPDNFNQYFPKHSILGKKSHQLIILGIVISLLSFIFGKFDVFNLLIYIFGILMVYNVININGRFDTIRYYFYSLLIVSVFDTFWILFLNREQNIDSSLFRVLVFGLTIISLIIKIVLSYLIRNRRR